MTHVEIELISMFNILINKKLESWKSEIAFVIHVLLIHINNTYVYNYTLNLKHIAYIGLARVSTGGFEISPTWNLSKVNYHN